MEMSPDGGGGDMGMMGPPRDLYELYMQARSELFSVVNFTVLYFKLIFLVDLGKEMLPEEYEGLRQAAAKLLEDANIYPKPSQMELSGNSYRISNGEDSTGLIEVRLEDINTGREESRDQKSTSLLPKIKEMDSKIFKALILSGVVEIKRPSMEEVLMQDVMAGIQEKMAGLSEDDGAPEIVEEAEEEESEEPETEGVDLVAPKGIRSKEESYDDALEEELEDEKDKDEKEDDK
jgi:hypothetical protein